MAASRSKRKRRTLLDKGKKLRFIDPLSPRILVMLRWLEAQGGQAQVRRSIIAKEVGMQEMAVTKWMRWCELYGAVHVDREKADFGDGSKPYTYRLLIPVADYERDAAEIAKLVKESLRDPKPKGRIGPKGVSAIDPKELAAIREQARLDVLEAIAAAEPLPPLVVDPLAYADVEAWGSAFNA